MINALAAMVSGVDDDAVAFAQALVAGDARRDPQQVTKQCRMLVARLCQ